MNPGSQDVPCGECFGCEGAFLGREVLGIIGINDREWSVLGAGAVATTNFPDNVTAVGVPARVIKKVFDIAAGWAAGPLNEVFWVKYDE